MALLAACGLIYEYLLAHYAGRILGSVDTTLYGMIGLMIVAMGIGAFYARTITCPYTGFAWLETGIAILGGVSVLLMAGLFSFAYILPSQLQQVYHSHETQGIYGGGVFLFQQLAEVFPYLIGLLLGAMVGMEIPLIARIREDIHQKHLQHNTGTIYGADYIGAGFGAAVWVVVCIKLPIIVSAVATAGVNLVVGWFFLAHYFRRVKGLMFLLGVNVLIALVLVVIAINGQSWMSKMNNMLFQDAVVFSENTRYQNIVITQRALKNQNKTITRLYINGHLQLASNDEAIYHAMLVVPPLMASARHEKVLVIGGGDGMAVRDILSWQPKSVTLIDLDPSMIQLFQGAHPSAPAWLSQTLIGLNRNALNDPRVEIKYGDAFKVVETLAESGNYYDVIIVDLPDPNHPDLNKLYSDYFYGKLQQILAADGAISVQSTSPYFAQKAFMAVGKTMASVGFNTRQYHTNVPSFGEWGWTIATLAGPSPAERIQRLGQIPVKHPWLSYQQVMAAFVFSDNYFDDLESIDVNRLNSPTLYRYHAEGWQDGDGVYFSSGLDL
ncbi:MAG: spermidine synthase [Alteromonadaceae bacterium]|nr:MAG: spermidine synthase [Alteromonadaceae bacterium]